MSDEIAVKLSRTYLKSLATEGTVITVGTELATVAAAALAEHDAEHNPLALPWETREIAHQANGSDRIWKVMNADGGCVADYLTKGEADLIAAAGDVTDALDRCSRVIAGLSATAALSASEQDAHAAAREALKKAGRR